jgi:hypothetical protein
LEERENQIDPGRLCGHYIPTGQKQARANEVEAQRERTPEIQVCPIEGRAIETE